MNVATLNELPVAVRHVVARITWQVRCMITQEHACAASAVDELKRITRRAAGHVSEQHKQSGRCQEPPRHRSSQDSANR